MEKTSRLKMMEWLDRRWREGGQTLCLRDLADHLWPECVREGKKGPWNAASGVAARLLRDTGAAERQEGRGWVIIPGRIDMIQMELPGTEE